MKITHAEIISSDKKLKGTYIHFTSKDNFNKGDKLELDYEGSKNYFEVADISVNGENLDVKAVEVGYWARKFDKKENFDLRSLIGLEITKIEDAQTIAKIREMSCWC